MENVERDSSSDHTESGATTDSMSQVGAKPTADAGQTGTDPDHYVFQNANEAPEPDSSAGTERNKVTVQQSKHMAQTPQYVGRPDGAATSGPRITLTTSTAALPTTVTTSQPRVATARAPRGLSPQVIQGMALRTGKKLPTSQYWVDRSTPKEQSRPQPAQPEVVSTNRQRSAPFVATRTVIHNPSPIPTNRPLFPMLDPDHQPIPYVLVEGPEQANDQTNNGPNNDPGGLAVNAVTTNQPASSGAPDPKPPDQSQGRTEADTAPAPGNA